MSLYDEFRDQAEQIEARQGFKCTEDQIRSIVGRPGWEEEERGQVARRRSDCPQEEEKRKHGG